MTTNVFGTFNVARGFLPSLISSGCASRIVMIGSQFGIRCSPGATAYSCSKAALFRLGESMAAELKATPVRVFVVAPGPVRTPLTEWPEELYLSQPELRSRQWVKPDRFTALVAQILTGDWDEFSGRYIHALEDLSALRARQNDILTQDLRTLRMTL